MDKTYSVAIDMCYFTTEHCGGKDQVAYNLLLGFEKIGVSEQIVCFCYENLVPIIRKYNSKVHIEVIPLPRKISNIINNHWRIRMYCSLSKINGIYMRKVACKLGVKLFVFPNKPTINLKFPMKTLVIPHDIQVFEADKLPGIHTSKHNIELGKKQIIRDFKIRDYIIAISDYDKNDMIKYMPWAEYKIHRVYNPIIFGDESTNRNQIKEYLTVINIQWTHKNTETVIKAYAKIANKTDLKLILVGSEPSNGNYLHKLVMENNLSDRVIFSGFVDDSELENIICKTRIYINPSLFEGFGMTAVEMMGRGIPTIVANSTAMPEVTQGMCRYYEPTLSEDALATEILAEIENPTSKEQLEVIADKIKSIYSYDNIASQYWDLFKKCMK